MSYSQGGGSGRERESRHLWVGGLPDDIDETGIKDYFSKFGRIEGVKILPQKYPNIGVAAFIDYYDVKSATEAKETKHKLDGHELRTNFKANPGDKHDHDRGGSRSHDSKEKHDRKESDSSSSGSESGSSSSSTSTDSDQETKIAKKNRKKASSSGGLFLKATGLANRPDRVLHDGLFYEFSRYSNSVTIRMYGDSDKKWAIIKYKRADKCKEALSQSQGAILFGSKIKLAQIELEGFPPGGLDQRGNVGGSGPEVGPPFMMEDLDPLATRSLFVGNIPKHISVYELRDAFLRYGNVLDVEIKKMGGSATYGFILYYDLMSAVTAKHYMDGHNLKGNNIRVGFGKGTGSKQLWIDGIDPTMAESQLERQLNKYGRIVRLGIDRHRCCAMVQYDSMEAAKEAVASVKGTYIKNSRRLMTDFANRDARAAFFNRMDAGGEPGLPPPRGFPGPPGPMYGAEMDPRLMMPPRPGAMHMLGRGGGFPPHGHPMDFYYNPFMEEYYGGRPPYGPPGMRRFPPGPGRGFGRDGPDDYDEELRAFSRKREREKRRRQTTSTESADSASEKDEDGDTGKKKKSSKGREKGKRSVKKTKKDLSDEGETGSESEDHHEEARLKATKKSRDLREKLKKMSRKKKNEPSSEAESSDEEASRSDKSKSKGEKLMEEDASPPLPAQKKVRKASPSSEPSLNKDEERRHSKSKTKSSREDSSPARIVRKKGRRSSRSPSLPSPQTPPRPAVPTKHKQERERKTPLSEEGSEPEVRNKSQERRRERSRDYRGRSPTPDGKKTKVSRDEANNVADAVPAKEEEEDDRFHEMKDPRIRHGNAKQVDTPQSPIVSTKSSHSSIHGNIESELSSGEDFKVEVTDWSTRKSKTAYKQKQEWSGYEAARQEKRADSVEKAPPTPPPRSPPRPRTPDDPIDQPGWREGVPRTPPSEDEEDKGGRKARKLPRRYQIEPPQDQGSARREGARYRDGGKDGRQERRHHAQPPSPSPPPQNYSTHQRKRYHHSPQPADSFDRRKRRGRAYSPAGGGGTGSGYQQRRRHSRSPPYMGSPPSHYRAKSPYGGSPPHGRPRSPIPRARAPRRRYDSPPYEGQRGKYPRGHGSPPSPHHRYPFSPTPPPRSSARSPQGRRYGRRRSSSLSPPRGGRSSRRERSPPSDHIRSSPRPSDDRYESMKRSAKRGYSRTPSPKDKYREAKEEYSDSKRRRVAAPRPKSPSGTPPPAAREEKSDTSKISRQQAHQPESTQSGPEERNLKQASSSSSSSAPSQQHSSQRQPAPADASKSSTHSQPPTSKSQAPPITPPENNLLSLLRRYPVMWQGMLMLKNDSAAVQLHFLSGNAQLAKASLPQQTDQPMPILRISQRMRLEKTQLEGVDRRIQIDGEHCLLLALPCGRDATDVHTQTHALKNNLINYLLQKQAAGIINVPAAQGGHVLHIFPPCVFSQSHLSRVAPDLLSNASVNCHLMIVVATM